MADWTKLETGDFITKSSDGRRTRPDRSLVLRQDEPLAAPRHYEQRSYTRSSKRHDEENEGNSSLLGVMGMAMLACVLLLVVSLSGTTVISDAWNEVQDVLQSDVPLDEALGKLKFVSNGIAEVFGIAKSDLSSPMINAKLKSEFSDSSGTIELVGDPKGDVKASAGGTIKLTSQDEGGYFVEIDHGNGLMTRYGMMSGLFVEEAQPVKQGDVLGSAGEDGSIFFGVIQRGIAVDPLKLLVDEGA